MKKTALNEIHHKSGAKMIPFAGYEMPVSYRSLNEEHLAVRNSVGIFDVSHMGQIFITGPGSLDLIQYITTNDASKLSDKKVQYTCMPNGNGGIIDDLLVYRLGPENYMLVVNASNIEKDFNWINMHNTFGARVENLSDAFSLFAVQGPNAVNTLKDLTDLDLEGMPYYSFDIGTFAGKEEVIISATGYTGAGGFEIYISNKDAVSVWNEIMEAGRKYNIQPIGLGARDTLRLEMGFCLYGNDIDGTTSPIEAGLGWITKFSKTFIDSERFKEQKDQTPSQKLVGFEMVEKGIPRNGYAIHDGTGLEIGKVTSGTMSPSLNKAIGMGYVRAQHAAPGSPIYISIRGKMIQANVVKLPFYNAKK